MGISISSWFIIPFAEQKDPKCDFFSLDQFSLDDLIEHLGGEK
jgi:hypothetical protein